MKFFKYIISRWYKKYAKSYFALTIIGISSPFYFLSTGIAHDTHKEKSPKSIHHVLKKKAHHSQIVKQKNKQKAKHPHRIASSKKILKAISPSVKAGAAAVTGAAVGGAIVQAAPIPPKPVEPDKGMVTGLPIPRFLSLRADEVNMRSGPGTRYPVIWVYHRRFMPMKVTREFDNWRLVEDIDGQKGWVQQAILSDRRTFMIKGIPLSIKADDTDGSDKDKKQVEHTDSQIIGYVADKQTLQPSKDTVMLREQPQDNAEPIAVLKAGVVGNIKECPVNSQWCKVTIKNSTGWVLRELLWGVLPEENIH